MRSKNPEERIRVRVNYVLRGYGLALTIREQPSAESVAPFEIAESAESIDLSDAAGSDDAAAVESRPDAVTEQDEYVDDGYLTVIECGMTTLELRKPDGQSSYLIWDESEMAWDSLLAG